HGLPGRQFVEVSPMDEFFRFSCPGCGKTLKALPRNAGKKAHCSCGRALQVPTPQGTEGSAAPEQAGLRGLWPWLAGGAAVLALAVGLALRLSGDRDAPTEPNPPSDPPVAVATRPPAGVGTLPGKPPARPPAGPGNENEMKSKPPAVP